MPAFTKHNLSLCVLLASALLLSACKSSSSSRSNPAPPTDNTIAGELACGAADTPETGIQGDIPAADLESGRAIKGYNCGLSPVHQLEVSGAVQGFDHCIYVRTGSTSRDSQDPPVISVSDNTANIEVYDVSNPEAPVLKTTLTAAPSTGGGDTSETLRVVPTENNPDTPALLAAGSSIFDISDCDSPVHKGDIQWPGELEWPAGLSHDIRISHDGTKVYASIGVVIADISDLDNPDNWNAVNYSCDIAAQFESVHAAQNPTTLGLCQFSQDQAPQLSHGPDDNAAGTRLYIGNQGIPAAVGDASGFLDAGGSLEDAGDATLRILDLTTEPPTLLAQGDGPGHAIDWFRTADGREYILHTNEAVFVQEASCLPQPRPSSLGWAFEAYITEVTGDTLIRRSLLELDINKAENCQAKMASGQETSIAYHSVDNPNNATIAMVSFGDSFFTRSSNEIVGAGLRVFDIRNPSEPQEVAYFNTGFLEHAGASYYDHDRGLLYMPDQKGVRVLELQPQILNYLGLPKPDDPAYPRYPNGRAATP